MTELKPCPFCGCKTIKEYIPSVYERGNDAEVYCDSELCGAMVRGDSIEICREKWNRRAT